MKNSAKHLSYTKDGKKFISNILSLNSSFKDSENTW